MRNENVKNITIKILIELCKEAFQKISMEIN